MAIFLAILKIIGIILLVILLLLLLIIAITLFLPVRYDLYGEYEDKFYAKFYICGFSGFLRLRGSYEEGKGNIIATAFWKLWQIYPKKVKKKKPIPKKSQKKESEVQKETPLTRDDVGKKTNINKSQDKKETTKKKRQKSNYQGIKRKSKNKGSTKKGFSYYRDEILKEENQKAFNLILKQVFWILKKVKPTIKMADITYSVGEPDLTGELTGIISLFPGAYGKKVNIYPDFLSEDPYVRGKIELTGRIYLVHIVIVAAKVFFNKDCRKLFRL